MLKEKERFFPDNISKPIRGSEKVDITAALFPVWLFAIADSQAMRKTIGKIEEELEYKELYRRNLECFDAKEEGGFLAGCFWMAQYYIMVGHVEKGKRIIEVALEYSNDLGFFAEEGDPDSGEMLGNFPQTFVHASFIGAVLDLNL